MRARHQEIEEALSLPEFWEDPQRAQEGVREHARLGRMFSLLRLMERTHEDIQTLDSLSSAWMGQAGFDELAQTMWEECQESLTQIEEVALMCRWEPADDASLLLDVRGDRAEGMAATWFLYDWCAMLEAYCDRQKLNMLCTREQEAWDGASTQRQFFIEGPNAYGCLKALAGTHQRQMTSVGKPSAHEELSESIQVSVLRLPDWPVSFAEDDLQFDVIRAARRPSCAHNGANAVRVTHLPTGVHVLVAPRRTSRLHRNRAIALRTLYARVRAFYARQAGANSCAARDQSGYAETPTQGERPLCEGELPLPASSDTLVCTFSWHRGALTAREHRTDFFVANADPRDGGAWDAMIRAVLLGTSKRFTPEKVLAHFHAQLEDALF